MLNYKGYIGHVEFDDEAELFHGEVINLRDVITFQGKTAEEIKRAFQESVEDYLAFCGERNEPAERPFSGKLNLRLTPELHKAAYMSAKLQGKSLNHWICDTLAQSSRLDNHF